MMIFDKDKHLQIFLVIPDPKDEKDAKRLKRQLAFFSSEFDPSNMQSF